MAAASNGSEYFEIKIEAERESFARPSNAETVALDEGELLWAAIERLPSRKQSRFAILRKPSSTAEDGSPDNNTAETVDVRKLDRVTRELVVQKAFDTNEQDNYKLLSAIKTRLDRVGLQVAKVDVRFENLNISAEVQTGSRALPTLPNFTRNVLEGLLISLRLFRPKRHSLTILDNTSGFVQPGR